MNELSTQDRLLETGTQLMLEKGYHDTGLTEILKAAGVPKGSFYHHFGSKEEFGLEVVDRFAAASMAALESHLADPEKAPLERLRSFFEATCTTFEAKGCREGCLLGNLGQELADVSDAFRLRIAGHLDATSERMTDCLREAQAAGDLDADLDVEELAGTLFNSWHGALMRMKVTRSPAPVQSFIEHFFGPAEAA